MSLKNYKNGVHEGTRTPDRPLRRRMLYPTELHGHRKHVITFQFILQLTILFEKKRK